MGAGGPSSTEHVRGGDLHGVCRYSLVECSEPFLSEDCEEGVDCIVVVPETQSVQLLDIKEKWPHFGG